MKEQKCKFFENTYGDKDEDGNDFITIDGYPADENAEGTVIVTIYLTPKGDFVTAWHRNDYRMNNQVLELIENSKAILLASRETKYAANIEWETDGEDVDLPTEVELPKDIDDDDIADYLSDKYEWLVKSFSIILK